MVYRLKTGVIKICKTCKKEFYVQRSRLKTKIYCSRKCTRTGKMLKCKRCGKEFYTIKFLIRQAKYCSKKCTISRRIRKCKLCKEEFYVSLCRIKIAKYCSKKCADVDRKSQFCPEGHNKKVVGQTKRGRCRKCKNIYNNKWMNAKYIPNPRKPKQFCVHGHDTFKYGRTKQGSCKKCVYKYSYLTFKKKYIPHPRKPVQFCPQGHDTFVVGRISAGGCTVCSRKLRRVSAIKQDKKRKKRIPKFGQKGIVKFYDACPDNKEIDHGIPLLGKKVSGLHVIWNLQYLTIAKNRSKGNRISLKKASRDYGTLLEKLGLK